MATISALPKDRTTTSSAAFETTTAFLPSITTHTDAEAGARFTALTARVCSKEPLTTILQFEAHEPNDGKLSEEHVLKSYALRTSRKLANGGVIIEAGDWAAAAIWDPPGADVMGAPLSSEERALRPIFAKWMDSITAAKAKYMGSAQKYWHLSMMVRDPRTQPPVKGAVRAVIEPYLRKAKEDGLPVWIEAANERARDVYGYVGFELLEEIRNGEGTHRSDGYPAVNGEDAPGVPTWFMIYNRPRSKESG